MGKIPDYAWKVPDLGESAAAVSLKPTTEPRPVEEVAAETRRRLEDPGWCLWRCSTLDGEVIVVVRDELVTGYPSGYPVYTDQELIELTQEGVGVEVIRLVHEAKKSCGAKIQEVQHVQV